MCSTRNFLFISDEKYATGWVANVFSFRLWLCRVCLSRFQRTKHLSSLLLSETVRWETLREWCQTAIGCWIISFQWYLISKCFYLGDMKLPTSRKRIDASVTSGWLLLQWCGIDSKMFSTLSFYVNLSFFLSSFFSLKLVLMSIKKKWPFSALALSPKSTSLPRHSIIIWIEQNYL